MNTENQESKKSTPFGTFLLWLLAITVILVVLGGVKQIFDGYKKAERQVELNKKQLDERIKKDVAKKYKYVSKDKFDSVTDVLSKEILCWTLGVTSAKDKKFVESLAIQLSIVTKDKEGHNTISGVTKDVLKENEDKTSMFINSLSDDGYSGLLIEATATCPMYHQQLINMLEGIDSLTEQEVFDAAKADLKKMK